MNANEAWNIYIPTLASWTGNAHGKAARPAKRAGKDAKRRIQMFLIKFAFIAPSKAWAGGKDD